MKQVLIAAVLLLAGCSSDDDKAAALVTLMKQCSKGASITMTVHVTSWSSGTTVSCAWIKKEVKGKI